jgi:hypothetical protein
LRSWYASEIRALQDEVAEICREQTRDRALLYELQELIRVYVGTHYGVTLQ